MKRKAIPQPKVRPGEVVSVENYRLRPPMWEHGECVRATYKLDTRGGHWQYDVLLNRQSDAGNRMWLYVGDERVGSDET